MVRQANGVQSGYRYDDADRLTAVDGVPVTHDNRGNLTSDGTWRYTYSASARMVRAESISATQVYTYNGDGLLVAQSLDGVETAFTWDQALGIPQVLATSDGVRSLYGLGRLAVEQGDQWYYPQGDALGSVRQWTDALAAVLAVQSYSPYGELRSGLAVAPWGFTGEWHDPVGLVYLRARWYGPSLGRFLQVDPVAGVADYAYQVHRNRQAGKDWGDALWRDVSFREVASVGASAGLAVLMLPIALSQAGAALSAVGYYMTGGALALGVGLGAPLAVWGVGTWLFGAADATAAAVYGLKSCPPLRGRLGGPDHRRVVNSIADDIESRGLNPVKEFYVRTPGGLKRGDSSM